MSFKKGIPTYTEEFQMEIKNFKMEMKNFKKGISTYTEEFQNGNESGTEEEEAFEVIVRKYEFGKSINPKIFQMKYLNLKK